VIAGGIAGGGENNLKRLAAALTSASEKLEAGEPLTGEEVGLLRTLPGALPGDALPRAARWAMAGAAALLLALGLFAVFKLQRPGEIHPASIELAMLPAAGTRSPGDWRRGDLFTIKASVPEDLYLHVLELDAEKRLELIFPLYDPAAGKWSYLGHEDNRVPRNVALTVPAEGFPMRLKIETGTAGEEFLLAFATREKLEPGRLLEIRAELRGRVEEAVRDGAGPEEIVARLRAALAGRAAAQAVLRFIVERSGGG
jgi:hypothetical protein